MTTSERSATVDAPRRRARAGWARRWGARLGAILIGLLLPLALVEVVLRVFGPILPGNYDTGAYLVRDAHLGHFHAPNFSGWIKAREFTTHVKINGHGLRDRRPSYEKAPGTYRILLLGDSYVEAVQVQQAEGIAERLETSLSQVSTRPIEVVNAGVAAYGTTQESLLLDQMGEELKPDLVVVVFFIGNDLTNNNYRLELWDGNLRLALKPYFDVGNDGSLRLIPGPPPAPRAGFSNFLRGCCVLYNVVETGVYNKLDQNYPREQLEAIGGLQPRSTGLYDTQPGGEWARAWRITESVLARMRDRSSQLGAPLVIVAAPEWRALDPAVWQADLQRGNPGSNRITSGRVQIEAPTQHLAATAQRLGVSFVDLLPPLKAAAERGEQVYFDFDKHWTSAGHAVAAEALHQALRDQEALGLDARQP